MSQITTPAQLKAAFPYMFARPMDEWAFGFARGWFPMIVRACEAIDALVGADRYQHRFHWVQIKEKFGTLRLYWQASDGVVTTQIAQIVRAAEEESARTCIACGAPGTLRRGGWILTLCDEHALQREQGQDLQIWFPKDPEAAEP